MHTSHAHSPVPPVESDHVVLVAISDAVLTDGSTGGDVASQAAVEVGHGVGILLGNGEQTFSQLLCHVEGYPVAILLIV